ncbi:hypothetical protein C883_3347 [Bacillus stratosphericus LAMA 585]|nr:hypothetical protein C883_3347 [Bacillus stratosphericus LAMA 585]
MIIKKVMRSDKYMRIRKEKEYQEVDGQLNQVMKTDVVHFSNDQSIQVKIHHTASSRRQGVVLLSENGFIVGGGDKVSTLIFWENKGSDEHMVTCVGGTMNLFNIWEEERMPGYHDRGSGMRVEQNQYGFVYHCYDRYTKEKDPSMIFSISFLSEK